MVVCPPGWTTVTPCILVWLSPLYLSFSWYKMLLPGFLLGARKREHISPVLASLHWLPVEYRVKFKVLLYVYKGLNGQASQYISVLIVHRKRSRPPRARLKLKGYCAFSVAAPLLWNYLPVHIRLSSDAECFKSLLKTYLFFLAFGSM